MWYAFCAESTYLGRQRFFEDSMGGDISSILVCDPPPPCPMGPLSCQGSIATGHTYGGAEGTRKKFFIPLAHVAPLPAQALERGREAPPLAQLGLGLGSPSWWNQSWFYNPF